MPNLHLTVRFLQPFSHGRGEDGLPEWPPSPLRLFQAIVASSIGHSVEGTRPALRWLERQPPPDIFAAPGCMAALPYRLYVPDNVGDLVASAWAAGREADPAKHRTEKDVRAMALDGDAVHFVFRNPDGVESHIDVLRSAARSITHLGWGIDMVVGNAELCSTNPDGVRWIPGRCGYHPSRWAVEGTLDDLERKHADFLARLDGSTFRPVPPLDAFSTVQYARADAPAPAPYAAFRLIHPETGRLLSFDTGRRARDVAAWTRHAVGEVAKSWPFGSAQTIVHGHAEEASTGSVVRISYLPLPSITPTRTDSISRVLITAPHSLEEQLKWVSLRMGGGVLTWDGRNIALLEPLPLTDWVLRRYVGAGRSWSTVTPVVLPGHDGHSTKRAERLLRKAFEHAGFNEEELATIEQLEWRKVGFRRGLELASNYVRPDKIEGTAYHVSVRFSRHRNGPLALGSGRHRGLGVFALD